MSEIFKEAAEKLKKEAAAGKFGRHGAVMKSEVAAALKEFCRQSDVFAEAVAHGGSFEECMKAVEKGVGSSISDLEAYKRAVKFYMKDAEVRFCMEIVMDAAAPAAEEPVPAVKKAEIIDLSAFW